MLFCECGTGRETLESYNDILSLFTTYRVILSSSAASVSNISTMAHYELRATQARSRLLPRASKWPVFSLKRFMRTGVFCCHFQTCCQCHFTLKRCDDFGEQFLLVRKACTGCRSLHDPRYASYLYAYLCIQLNPGEDRYSRS